MIQGHVKGNNEQNAGWEVEIADRAEEWIYGCRFEMVGGGWEPQSQVFVLLSMRHEA